MGIGSIVAFLNMLFFTQFWIRLLVLDGNRNLGDCSHIFANSFDDFHKECFHPVAFIYLLFFVNKPSLFGGRDYGLMIIQTRMKVDVCTALASIYHTFVQVFFVHFNL